MPFGAFRLNSLGLATVAAAPSRTGKRISVQGDVQVDTAQSKFGGASILFDGTGDLLKVQSHSDFAYGTGDFTIEFWIRYPSAPGTVFPFDARDFTDGSVVKPTLYHSGGVLRYFLNGADRITYTWTPTSNTWYHIALCRSSGTTRLFLDGTQIGSSYTDSNSYVQHAYHFGDYAGFGYGASIWLDEIRISNSARYTGNFTAPSAAFTNDSNTILLIHGNGVDASNSIEDDATAPTYSQRLTSLGPRSNDNWRGNDMAYFGNDSSGRPVFVTGYTKVTTQYPTLVMFRVNNDLTITRGSEYTLDGTNTAVYISVASERDGAGLRTASGFENYGYAVWTRNAANTGARAVAFSYDIENLTITLGTNIAIAGTTGGQGSGHYIGNRRVVGITNGGSNGNYLVQNWATRTSGSTTLTKNAGADNSVLGFYGQGGGYNTKGMSTDRWIVVPQAGNNGHGWFVSAIRTNGSTGMVGVDYNYNDSTTDDVFNSESKVAQLNNTDRFITICNGTFANNTVNGIKALAGTVTWNTGSTNPSIALGSVVTLETNANYRFGVCEGTQDGEAFFIFSDNADGYRLKYKKLTVTTNTISASAYTTITEVGTTAGHYVIDATRMVQNGNNDWLMVIGARNGQIGNVDIIVVKNPT